MTSYLLGIDAGLTRTKAVIFTPDGDVVAEGSQETPINKPAPDHHEVDLEELWQTVSAVIKDTLEQPQVRPADVNAIGIAGHGHGLYALDVDGDPVRPGIKSTDNRATVIVEKWNNDGTSQTIREHLGYSPFAADPLSLLGWLAEHEPNVYKKIDKLLFCKDYIKYRLTGNVCTDEMEASVFYNPRTGEYDPQIFRTLGLGSCTDALPDVIPSWDVCGGVTATAAQETGLIEGTSVASGLHDVGATALGAGAYSPGQGVLIVGTWGQSIVISNEHTIHEKVETSGLSRRYLANSWLRYKGNRSASACVDWFVEEVGHEWHERANNEGVNPYTIYDRVVKETPAGALGLLFHPYLSGSTDNPTDRGGFYGLTMEHTKEHMLRAIYEGVAISQSISLDELKPETGLTDIRLGGGGSRSKIWSDIFATTLDHELLIPAGEEVGARGAAISAGIAIGEYPDHKTAVNRMVVVERHHTPDQTTASIYRNRHEVFKNALRAIRPTWEEL